eukprot:COSAG01_NODE_11751_length_1867_cov_2.766403_1_plen_165_part_00
MPQAFVPSVVAAALRPVLGACAARLHVTPPRIWPAAASPRPACPAVAALWQAHTSVLGVRARVGPRLVPGVHAGKQGEHRHQCRWPRPYAHTPTRMPCMPRPHARQRGPLHLPPPNPQSARGRTPPASATTPSCTIAGTGAPGRHHTGTESTSIHRGVRVHSSR